MMGLSQISLGAENKEEPVMFLLLGVKVAERERAREQWCTCVSPATVISHQPPGDSYLFDFSLLGASGTLSTHLNLQLRQVRVAASCR